MWPNLERGEFCEMSLKSGQGQTTQSLGDLVLQPRNNGETLKGLKQGLGRGGVVCKIRFMICKRCFCMQWGKQFGRRSRGTWQDLLVGCFNRLGNRSWQLGLMGGSRDRGLYGFKRHL